MTYSIMEALFDGRIIPWERRSPPTPERRELAAKIENEKRHFVEKMSLDDCKRFEELENLYNQAALDEEVGVYAHGFTLGALLMMEVMEQKQSMF